MPEPTNNRFPGNRLTEGVHPVLGQPGRLEGAGRATSGAREVPARPARQEIEGSPVVADAAPSSGTDAGGGAAQPLKGKAFRDAVKAAQSKLAKQQRTDRGKYVPRHVKGAQRGPAGPGMVRRVQPPEGGSS